MDRTTMKVEIEGVGVFTTPMPVVKLLEDENKRAGDAIALAERAVAEADRLRKELEAIKSLIVLPPAYSPAAALG